MTEEQDDGMGASTAKITLNGSSEESRREAYVWLSDILLCPHVTRVIQNNFITHFGEEEYLQLTKIICKYNVSIEELLEKGMALLVLNGALIVNVAVAFLEVENMLCKIQKDFVKEEENLLSSYTNSSLKCARRVVPISKLQSLATNFWHVGLEIVKVQYTKMFCH